MKAMELAESQKGSCRKIAITLNDPGEGVLSVMACYRQSKIIAGFFDAVRYLAVVFIFV